MLGQGEGETESGRLAAPSTPVQGTKQLWTWDKEEPNLLRAALWLGGMCRLGELAGASPREAGQWVSLGNNELLGGGFTC